MMDDHPRAVLKELINRFGESLAGDPLRTEGLLRDTCGHCPREIFVLVSAIRQRVPADLLAPRTAIPPELLRDFLIKRLTDELSLTDEASRWAVESWAEALGIMNGSSGATGKPVPPVLTSNPGPGDPEGIARMARLSRDLESPLLEVRLRSVGELARDPGPGSTRILVSALGNGNWQVRSGAFDALSGCGLPAVPALRESLEGSNDQIIWRACLILGALQAREAAGPLAGLLVRKGIIRECALWSLGEIGDESSSTAILPYINDPDPVVRKEAELALIRIGKKKADPAPWWE